MKREGTIPSKRSARAQVAAATSPDGSGELARDLAHLRALLEREDVALPPAPRARASFPARRAGLTESPVECLRRQRGDPFSQPLSQSLQVAPILGALLEQGFVHPDRLLQHLLEIEPRRPAVEVISCAVVLGQ